jgi:hypothetical protein
MHALNGRDGEGFWVPEGVRKPLMQEPAGHCRRLWGFRTAADVGVGATDAGKRRGGCGQAASLLLRAVLAARNCSGRREPSVIKLLEMATAAGWDAAQVSYAIMMLAATNLKSSDKVSDQP